ncbi:LOW QUALITY PROTEIN: hypothetical protein ACHAXR_006045 [Thalassiosira sp. AJA248-18]
MSSVNISPERLSLTVKAPKAILMIAHRPYLCMKANELVISKCGDGVSCNALWDKRLSTVTIPAAIAQAPLDNPSDPEVIESARYSRLSEPYMPMKSIGGPNNAHPSWTYFGAHNGLFRKIPATYQEECGQYDPRHRPWFVAASSGPKDVVLVIDTSGSMNDYGRIDLAKEAAITVVSTLTVADRVAVVSFSDFGKFGIHSLIRATKENKEISAGQGANEVINLVNERMAQLAANFDRKTTVFTFSLGVQADHAVTKNSLQHELDLDSCR